MATFDPAQPFEEEPTVKFDPSQPFTTDAAPKDEKPQLPMPGPLDAMTQGMKAGLSDIAQTGHAIEGTPLEKPQEPNAAAAPFEWSDIGSPIARGLPKLAYRVGESWPSLGAGVAGGMAGTAAAGPAGGLVGGTLGAAGGAAFQKLGPYFQQELAASPNDPDGAWDRAMHKAEVSGAFSGAGWALFPLRAFSGPLKQLAFQAFGVQPAVSVGEQATQNVMAGKPVTENLGQAYAEGAVGTAVPALGHMAIKAPFGKEPVSEMRPYDPAPVEAKRQQAVQLEQQAQAPNTPPDQAATLRKQAYGLRFAAAQEEFLGQTPQPLQKRSPLASWWQRNFQPETVSEKALQADPLFAQYRAATAQERDSIINRAEDNYYRWNKVPTDDIYRFFQAYQHGQPVPADLLAQHPWMQERYDAYHQMLEEAYNLEKTYGSKAGFIQDYLPQMWKDPVKARQTFDNLAMPQSLGPKWFQKSRFYDDIEAGLNAGLELRTTNPEELVTNRLLSGVDMRKRVELLNDLREQGVAVPVKEAPRTIAEPSWRDPNPWQKINAPNGEQWAIAPDIQPLWENAVNAKGLWQNEGLSGNAFRGWMAFKNAWVPVRLALSAFHPLHVAHINMSNNLTRALNETVRPGEQGYLARMSAVPQAIAQNVFDNFLALPIGTPFKGKTAREAWATPRNEQTPEQRQVVDMMTEGGFSPQLSEQLRISAKRGFSDAWNNNQYLKLLPIAVRRGIEMVQKPIFEKWIPNLKAAAYLREAESLFRRRPDLLTDDTMRKVALRSIGKQVDNRFGEMFYSNMFWNRTLKDAGIGSFLSLGWNLGFAREFMGGALEPIGRQLMDAPTPTRALIRDTTSKATNAFIYTMSAMAINGLMNYGMTGQYPEGQDYIFPRIGGNNPDGSPRRISNMFYTREVPMAEKNIEERQSVIGGLGQMLYHKMMVDPFVEAGTNRDYFGYQIYDENAPGYKQAYQIGKYVLDQQLNPFSITGAKRALQLSGKPYTFADVLKQASDRDVVLPMMGFNPAPAYASKDPMQNRIGFQYSQFVAPTTRPFEQKEQMDKRREARDKYLLALQTKDQAKIGEAAKELAQTGVKASSMTKMQPGTGDVYMFSRLPKEIQAADLKDSTKEQFKRYYPKAKKEVKADPDVQKLWRYYYQ